MLAMISETDRLPGGRLSTPFPAYYNDRILHQSTVKLENYKCPGARNTRMPKLGCHHIHDKR